jgi:integrase
MRGSKRELRRGVWELRVSIGRDSGTGKYRTVSRTFRGSAGEANDALRDLIDEQAGVPEDGRRATVGTLLDRWLEECERLDLSPTTIRSYRSQIDHRIQPELGSLRLTALSAANLDALYGRMKGQNLSAKTIRNCHAVISSALHQAVRWGWVRENAANRAKPPRLSERRAQAPSVDAIKSLIEAAERRDPRVAALLMLGALTGLRRGELCALRWTDVNMDVGRLEVSRSVIVTAGGVAEKSTKTGRDRRVALDEVGVQLLCEHRARTAEWASKASAFLRAEAFVFSPELDGSRPFRPDGITSFFSGVRTECGLTTVRLHDLRHFTATQLIGANVDIRTVAGRLGHSDPSVTLRVYSHVIAERDQAAAAVLGDLFRTTPRPAAGLPQPSCPVANRPPASPALDG